MTNTNYDPDHLPNLLEAVYDEASFLCFVDALADDFALERKIEGTSPPPPYSHGALGWENGTVDAVFDAAQAYGIDSKGEWMHTHGNIWRRCAEILFAGKFYE